MLGGCSCLLFGDFGQLPPVMDLPLYTTDSRNELSDQDRNAYQQFDKGIILDKVMVMLDKIQNKSIFARS